MRRLPIYFLLDTSTSVNKILEHGIKQIIDTLKENPQAIETAYVSIITFGDSAQQLFSLTAIANIDYTYYLDASKSRSLGLALSILIKDIEREVVNASIVNKGDWNPIVFIMLSDYPSDEWKNKILEFKQNSRGKLILVLFKELNVDFCKSITENVISLNTANSHNIANIFSWETQIVKQGHLLDSKHQDEKLKMRRLPVYFLLDTSGSMFGEPIQALNNALAGMVNTLRSDPQALDSLWISIITFDREVKELVPLTELVSFQLPEITCPQSGPTHTGKGLQVLYENVRKDIRRGSAEQKGDWKPLLFLFTDGKPSDVQLYKEMVPRIKGLNFSAIVGCAAGHLADDTSLKELTDNVVHLDTADTNTLKAFFKWVSDTIEQGNKSQGTGESVALPPPPAEINLVI